LRSRRVPSAVTGCGCNGRSPVASRRTNLIDRNQWPWIVARFQQDSDSFTSPPFDNGITRPSTSSISHFQPLKVILWLATTFSWYISPSLLQPYSDTILAICHHQLTPFLQIVMGYFTTSRLVNTLPSSRSTPLLSSLSFGSGYLTACDLPLSPDPESSCRLGESGAGSVNCDLRPSRRLSPFCTSPPTFPHISSRLSARLVLPFCTFPQWREDNTRGVVDVNVWNGSGLL